MGKNKNSQNNQANAKKSGSVSQKPSAENGIIDKDNAHDYTSPVAGEDGRIEDQNKKPARSKDKQKSSTQGKNPGENLKF